MSHIADFLKFFIKPLTIVSLLLIGSSAAVARFAWSIRLNHEYSSNFLTNLAIAFISIAAATIVAAFAARRFSQMAVPILTFIRQLREDKKISPPLARHSVILAVAVLSEGNVTARIKQKPEAHEGKPCPVCLLPIELVPRDPQNRCLHCKLPGALWSLRDDAATEALKGKKTEMIPPSAE